MPMSLDGLRAWIGEVERKLGVRTRVFLVLLAIAIGASGAAIYLALEADDSGAGASASAEEVQSLREQVELEGGGADTVGARSRRSSNCGRRSKPCRPSQGRRERRHGQQAAANPAAAPGPARFPKKKPKRSRNLKPNNQALVLIRT